MEDSPPAPVDVDASLVVTALANVAMADVKSMEKRTRKLERLQREAKAAERKALVSKRALELEAKKRAKPGTTMRSYFSSSRNSLNRGPLLCKIGGGVLAASSSSQLGDEVPESVDTEVLLSSPAVVPLSAEGEHTGKAELELDITDDEMEDSDAEAFEDPPPRDGKKRKSGGSLSTSALAKLKKSYDLQRKFQNDWAAKEPWSELVLGEDGVQHLVRCNPCSVVRGKPIHMAPKWDTISKHGQRDVYKKCMTLFAARGPAFVAEMIQGCSTVESRRKRVQFATLFQVLSSGRPISEFEARFELYDFLEVPELPRKHWAEGSAWVMAEHVYDFVKERIKTLVSNSTYFALSADETTACDNSSWLAIHAYVVVNWSRVPLLLSIQKMESDGATATKLTSSITNAVLAGGGVTHAELQAKLLCFGADGVSTFQGLKSGVTTQIKEKYAPFATGIHCCAHRLNLAAQSLSSMTVMHAIEEVLRVTHAYFAHSPKKAAEFCNLAQQLESKGLKMLKNVKTRWMSCLGPIRRLLAEYKGVIAMMLADKDDRKWGQKARANLALLVDPYVLLGMLAMLPMLEAIDTLIQWAQKRDAFICDFVGGLATCQSSLFTCYLNEDTAFRRDEFHAFNQVVQCSHEQILMKWEANLNLPCESLTFVVGGHSLYALHGGNMVNREGYAAIVAMVQSDCKEAARKLMDDMAGRFPDHGLMDALEVVYPQYWLQGDCASSFRKHLDVIRSFYCEPKWIGEGANKRLIPPVLDKFLLESEQPLFKIAMIANAHAAMEMPLLNAPAHQLVNPLTKLWRTLDANSALGKHFGEYIKLAHIAMVHVLGSVEDERTFSALSFLKDRLRNRLDQHLGVVVEMHCQSVYTLKSFPYDDCYKQWSIATERQRYSVLA